MGADPLDEEGEAAEFVNPAELRVWAGNPRNNEEAVDAVAASILRFGFAAPIVARRANREVIAGHTRLKAALKLNLDRVPVRYVDLGEAEAHALALADNRLGEIATWHDAALGEALRNLTAAEIDVGGLGWSDEALGELAARPAGGGAGPTNPGADPDDEPEERPDAPIESVLGELYELGPHRLICGDSTKAATFERLLAEVGGTVDLIFTDPPYAIYGSSTGLSSSITDDKIVRPFFLAVLERAQAVLPYFGAAYVCCDWRSWPSWWEQAKSLHLEPKNLLVWDKNGSGLGSNWSNTYELIGYFLKVPEQKTMQSKRKAGIRPVLSSNVIRYNRPTGDDRQHNAAKPVGLVEHVITKTGDHVKTVLDLFGGSGTTLIAAARVGRRAFVSEIEPRYCDIIRRRWTAYAVANGIAPGPGQLAALPPRPK
jgi:site-specific DNA-methyltransferase (adenine-specific)